MGLASTTFGIIGFFTLVFLSGGWVSFGLPLSGLSFWARFFLGTALSPLVVCVQFFAIRLLGASFELTIPVLVVLNLPVLALLWRRRGEVRLPGLNSMILWVCVLAIPVACLVVPQFLWPTHWLYYYAHAWLHADVVYMIANGALLPEEPMLAGIVLSYPWVGIVFQAALSFLLDSPPVATYGWTNLLYMLTIVWFTAASCRSLGGGNFAAVSSVVFLLFGVNFVGYFLGLAVPDEFVRGAVEYILSTLGLTLPRANVDLVNIWGDWRFTPWLWMFGAFGQNPLALSFFGGLLFLFAAEWRGDDRLTRPLLVFLLLTSTGLIYPLVFPAAFAVVCLGTVKVLLDEHGESRTIPHGRLLGLVLVLAASAAIGSAYIAFLSQDRGGASLLGLSHPFKMVKQAWMALIVTLPLLCTLALVFFRCLRRDRNAALFYLAGALASILFYITLDIPHWKNEYKFIFTAAICLAPFSGLALEPLEGRLGKLVLPFSIVLTLVLAAPYFHKHYRLYPPAGNPPALDVSSFDLRFDDAERFSGLVDAIRERTPVETVLVVDRADFNFPTVTRRAMFAPPEQERPSPGVLLTYGDLLGNVRGYDAGMLEERALVVRGLFEGDDDSRSESLGRIRELGRPMAVVLDESRQGALLDWLEKKNRGARLYSGNGLVLWVEIDHNDKLSDSEGLG